MKSFNGNWAAITHALLLAAITFWLPAVAYASPYWNQSAGTIENPISNVVGYVQNNHAYQDSSGQQPLSGVSDVQGSDGQMYTVKADGLIVAQSDDQSSSSSSSSSSSGDGQGSSSSGGSSSGGSSSGGDSGSSNSSSSSGDSQSSDATLSQFKKDYYDPNLTVGASVAWEYIPQTGGTALAGDGAPINPGLAKQAGRDVHTAAAATGGGLSGGTQRMNELINAFDGWSQLYRGVRDSPVLTDLYDQSKAYPQFMSDTQDKQRPQMGPAFGQEGDSKKLKKPSKMDTKDVGVDDEILKTSMSVYQPIHRLQHDFLGDEKARDDYLDSALTVRGVAITTMGFLDKTVGASLTAIQQQADNNTMQQLLKQVSWTTSKMANQDRSQVYRDTDEKLEACLEISLKKKTAAEQVKGLSRKIVDFQCSKSCGAAPKASLPFRDDGGGTGTGGGGGSSKKEGNGSYAYCVCCAETSTDLNKITEDGVNTEDADKGKWTAEEKEWSLVERVVYGTKLPDDGQLEAGKKIKKIARIFKESYGDVFLQNAKDSGGEPNLRYVLMFPRYSVARKIRAFRDGCYACTGQSCPITGPEACPIQTDLNINERICPSLIKVLQQWDVISKGPVTDDQAKLWVQASLGYLLTGRDVQNILAENGDPLPKLEGEPSGKMKRVIQAFCDASAVSAFTRFHTRFQAIMSDHLAMNQQVSENDKQKLAGLMNRVSEQLALAKADIASSGPIEEILTGISVSNDRRVVGYTAASGAANLAQQTNNSARNGESAFGRLQASTFYNSAGSSSGSVSKVVSDPIDSALSGLDP